MNTKGIHVLAEFWRCDRAILDDKDSIDSLIRAAVLAADASLVHLITHRFAPQGVSGVAVLEESHLSMHTWPEAGYAAVDIFTCGGCLPEQAVDVLREGLCAERSEVMVVDRGVGIEESMVVRAHRSLGQPDSTEVRARR